MRGKKAKLQLKTLRVAAKAALKTATTIGQPGVAEIDPHSAGFHDPDTEVRLQIFFADGRSCGIPPVVEVVNDSFGSAGDLGSLVVDEMAGVIALRLGPGQGGVRVNVSVCGNPPTTVLLYNYGPPPPRGLPNGFPTNLPPGDYQMSFAGSVSGQTIPTTVVGVFSINIRVRCSIRGVSAFGNLTFRLDRI